MSKKRVLVVDDEPSLLRLLQVTLETEGYDVVLASDGETAVKRVEQDRPDIMLLDVMMPVIDGWGVLERLHDVPKRPRIICLSAKTNRRDLVKGWTLGADEYLTKPFSIDQLLDLLTEIVERTPQEQEARRSKAIADLGG
jgi:DNA-binding response OmpR family regulator